MLDSGYTPISFAMKESVENLTTMEVTIHGRFLETNESRARRKPSRFIESWQILKSGRNCKNLPH